MKKFCLFAMAMIAAGLLTLAGCSNTLHGVGQDVEKAGRSIQKTF